MKKGGYKMKYGIPYKGSKSKIAKDILTVLPQGRVLWRVMKWERGAA